MVTLRSWSPLMALFVIASIPRVPGHMEVTVQAIGDSPSVNENESGIARFEVSNWIGYDAWFTFDCTRTGQVTGCTDPSNFFIEYGESETINVAFQAGSAGSGSVTLKATGDGDWDQDTHSVAVTIGSEPPGPAPVNWDESVYNYDNQRCADTCSGLTLAHSTVPYFTMDTPGNVTLVYNSERAAPRPLVQVDVKKPSSISQDLEYIKLRIKEVGVGYKTFVNGSSQLFFDAAGEWTRIGGRLINAWTTGMVDIQIEVTFYYESTLGTQSVTQTWDTKLMVVDDSDAPLAEGWTVAGLQRLYVQSDSSVLIVEGGGPAAWFWKDGTSWVSPKGDMSTVSKNGSGFKRVYPDQTDVRFNSDGEMTDVYDPDDNRTQFGYHSSPTYDLFYIQDPMGKRTYTTFNSIWMRYHIYADISPYRYTILEFTSGRLTKIKDPDGDSTVINYTSQTPSSVYFPTSVTDRSGNTTSYEFYAKSLELWKVTAPAVDIFGEGSPVSPITEFAPWPREVSPVSTTSSGSPFDAPASDDVWGSVTAPGGAVTSTRVNRFGSPLEIDAPAGTYDTEIAYNQHGSPVKVVRSDGWGSDSILYDIQNRPIWLRSDTSAATPRQFKYGAFSQVDSAWGGGQATQDFFVNGTTGRIDSVKTGNTAMTRYTYNSEGQLRRVKNAEGDFTTRIGYDGLGNTVADTSAESVITTFGRDSYGRVTSVATSGLATRTMAYDVMNRPTDIDDGVNGQDTQYDYSPTYVRLTDPKGQVYDEYVNAVGWVTSSEDPLNDSHDYEYDVDGLVRRWTNRRGQNVNYTYDTLGRLKTLAGDTLSYASAGKTVTATNAYVTKTAYLNHRGQPDLVTTYFEDLDKTYTLEYTYNSDGVLTEVEPSGDAGTFMTRTYSYNAAKGTLNWIKLDGEETDFAYALDLALSQYGFPGGNDVELGRTGGNQLEWTNADAGYGTYTDRSVEYDKGRIQVQAVPGLPAGHRYGYDGLGRLLRDTTIEYTGSCGFDEETGYDCGSWTYDGHVTYSYDAANNRTDLSAGYVSGSNRMSSFDGCSYSTDDDGNITSQDCPGTSNDYTFHWDARNRLDSLNSYKFRYDPSGRLTRIDVSGSPYRYFWWDGDNLLAELDTDGTVIAEYSYYPGSLDRLHAVRKGGSSTKYYAQADAAGNVVGLTYGANPAETYVYDAWGQPAGGGTWVSVPNRAHWKGALHFEEFDLYYMRARWYQPRTGRFLSEDPIGLEGGINPYVFGGADPINRRDPKGLWCQPVEQWVEGTEASGWVWVLHCENVSPGDFYTIRDWLNDGVPGSGDAAWDVFQGAGWTQGGCGGWNSSSCHNLRGALARLTLHANNTCSDLGVRATKRFQGGDIRPNPGLAQTPYIGWAYAFPLGLGWTDLEPGFVQGGRHLTSLLAHEERHHDWGRRLLGFIPFPRVGHPQDDPFLSQVGAGHPCS